MAELTPIYKYYYLQFGDKWYPGIDFDNMQISENQLEFLNKFIGPCVGTGWTLEKLSDLRNDQLTLISSYLNEPSSELSQNLKDMNLDFSSSFICSAGSTNNINLSGGAPNTLDGIQLSTNDQILVKDQTNKSENGIYKVSTLGTGSNGTWTRSEILDTSSDFNTNFLSYVSSGIANTSTLWIASSLGNTFGTNPIYFDNVFKQCVKVYPGDGIVDIFYGKTENPYYFRFQNEDNYYIWADKTTNIEYNNICKIVSPNPPDQYYGKNNNSTYIAKIKSSFGSTLYDLPIVDKIIYGPDRKELKDSTNEFQSSLGLNFSNHKHLGESNTPSKIDLNTGIILNAIPEYQNNLKQSSSVFLLKNSDGTDFTGTFDAYGIPKVYLNSTELSDDTYRFDLSTSNKKLIFKNSIDSKSTLKVELLNYSQKKLSCIDSSGNLLISGITSSTVYLTDGTTEDRTPSDNTVNLVYKNFSWLQTDYLDVKLYVNDILISPKHYTIDPNNAKITINSTFPYISVNNFDDIKIIIDAVGNQIQNKLNFNQLENIDASSISKGTLSENRISNLSHEKFVRSKNTCEFVFTKNLISGFGLSYFYPYNSNSDLQFNTEVFNIAETKNNSSNNYIYCTQRGLMSSDNTFTKIKNINSWNNDLGRPILFKDDILQEDNENINSTSYLLTNKNEIYFSKDSLSTWEKLKTPNIVDKNIKISAFDISSDRQLDSSNAVVNSSVLYLGSNDGLYSSQIISNQLQDQWEWNEIEVYSNDNEVSLTNINSIVEISTKNIEFKSSENDLTTYDRHIYVGSSDSDNPGLYYGNQYIVSKIFDDSVKGISWLKEGTVNVNKNCIIWWDDYDVYLTHASRLVLDSNSSYWDYPFQYHDLQFDNVKCATIENITLSGLQTIDGYVLSANDKVLVKNQTTKSQNGIYLASSGAWTRSSQLDETSDFENFKHTYVENGDINGDNSYHLKPNDSFVFGTSDIEWDFYRVKIYSTTTPSYTATRSVVKDVKVKLSQNNTLQYIIAHTDGLVEISDGSVIETRNLIWDRRNQGYLNSILSLKTESADGEIYASSQNGFYKSTSFLWIPKNNITDVTLDSSAWNRTESFFGINDNIVIKRDSESLENFNKYFQWQLINILDTLNIGDSLKYENDFRQFSVDPWFHEFTDSNNNYLNPNVIVYINDKPTKIPYTTDAVNGSINFVSSVPYTDYQNVKITISSLNNYISNTGNLTHDELFISGFKSSSIARLAIDSNSDDTILYLNQEIDQNLKTLILDDGSTSEIIYVDYVNNYKTPVEVYLSFNRTSTNSNYTFKNGSTVYRIKDGLTKNIQDNLYTLIRNEKYNLSSLNNVNTSKLILELEESIPTLFDISPSAPIQQTDTRGLKNLLYTVDLTSDSIFDSNNSINSLNYGNPSIEYDKNYQVNHIFDIENLSNDSVDSLAITEKGLWKYNGSRWLPIDDLNFGKTNFIKEYKANNFKIGTNEGLYEVDSNFNVVKNTIFSQKVNDFIFGQFDGNQFECYAKSDGFLLITNPDSASFQSQYISELNEVNVNGLFKTQNIRIENNNFVNYDVIFASSDKGLHAICSATNSDIFSPSISSKQILQNPEGVSVIRNCFVPYNIPTIPNNNNSNQYLFILTNDGILKANNYLWCDPLDSNGKLLNIESRFLRNLDCLSYATNTDDAVDALNPGISKIFIGTSYGVYRSRDGGSYFELTNRFGKKLPVVYSLKYFESTYLSDSVNVTTDVLVATTDIGIWYSIDDGDNWYKSGEETDDSELPINAKSSIKNEVEFTTNISTSNYLAQSFQTLSSPSLIDKVSVKLIIDNDLRENVKFQKSLLENTIQVTLCALDVNDKPNLTSVLASSSTSITPNDLTDGQYQYFQFNYTTTANQKIALVIRENVTSNGISILRWDKARIENVNNFGEAFTYYNSTWIVLDHTFYSFNFRVFYDEPVEITETEIEVGINNNSDIGWDQGKFKGTYVDENGYLKINSKFLITLVVDDTYSMSEQNASFNFIELLKSFVDDIKSRTLKTVNSESIEFSAFDLWTLNNSLQRYTTSGHITESSTVSNDLDTLVQDGSSANLLNAIDSSLNALLSNAINELYWKYNDSENSNRISNIVDYLDDSNSLRLSHLNDLYDQSDIDDGWDGTQNTINESEEASRLLLKEFAKQYIPVMIVITDGENKDNNDLESLKFKLNNFWNDFGINLNIFSLSKSKFQSIFNDLTSTERKHFHCFSEVDLENGLDSLLHEGDNSIFKGYWSRDFYYDDAVYISNVYAEFTEPTGTIKNSSCKIEFKYSTDYENFSSWITLSSSVPYILNKKITNINYRVTLTEGWDGDVVSPEVQLLYHTVVDPSVKYLYTDKIDTMGFINELYLTSNFSDNDVAFEWGISRSDSWNWLDYDSVKENKNFVLPFRQKDYKSTNKIEYKNLILLPIDSSTFNFYIMNGSSVFKWSDNYTISVKISGAEIQAKEYRVDNYTGVINFNTSYVNYENITIDIIELENIYKSFGESTTTSDLFTYSASNGGWNDDENIAVLVNNEISRENYILDKNLGTVTFRNKKSISDVVSIFVLHPEYFRLGVKVISYNSSPSETYKFALQYTLLENLNKLSEKNVVSKPYISENRIQLQSELKSVDNSLSVNYPISISYDYISDFNTDEYESDYNWFIKKTTSFSELNNVPNYVNRNIQRIEDLNENNNYFEVGDELYVKVRPNDKFKNGLEYESEIYSLTDYSKPFVSDVKISNNSIMVSNISSVGIGLTAKFNFYDSSAGSGTNSNNSSIVKWYDRTSSSFESIYEGFALPASFVNTNSILYYVVTPFNNVSYGNPVVSNSVLIV